MRTLYLECNMGAAGDMITAALLELLPEKEQDEFISRMNSLGLPGVTVSKEKMTKCGILATHVKVTVNGEEEESQDVQDHAAPACADGITPAEHTHDPEDHDDDHDHDSRGHGDDDDNHIGHSHGDDDHDVHDHGDDDHDHNGHSHGDDDHDHDGHSRGEHGHDHEGHHHHHHTSLADMRKRIDALDVSAKVKGDIESVYSLIAQAESHAHGVPVDQIHFHEVGTLDALADIAGAAILMEKISPEQVVVSPIQVGSGEVRCAHGILPVPAPATAYILRGVPTYSTDIRGELCTPTGAALLRHYADSFGGMPVMSADAIGYGCGMKDFPAANVVRAVLGESFAGTVTSAGSRTSADSSAAGAAPAQNGPEPVETAPGEYEDHVVELVCNLDDCTPEEISFAEERLWEAGAVDVFTESIMMKKNRPGVMLTVLVKEDHKKAVIEALFRNTTTLGVRERLCRRYVLSRSEKVRSTEFGPVRFKGSAGYGVIRQKPEYEDIAKIAREKNLTIADVRSRIESEE
ncbi:MAG: nickel pincer cofactor biosynthesis protein LarC [Lachnospiraceae bacterium]|jgi:uncharacterized protein (TIGR00299 family) protein